MIVNKLQLLFVDETQLLSRDQQALAWRQPAANDSSTNNLDPTSGITLVAVFGINGLVAYDLIPGWLNCDRYLVFLERLHHIVGQRHVGLFYDG